MQKRCFKCHRIKPIESFYKHPQMADGHLGKCKACTKRDTAERYASPEGRQKVRAYEQKRFRDPLRKLAVKGYQQNRRTNNPGKYKARTAVGNALRDGRLKVKPCEVCGNEATQAHHDDYRRPLAVRWFCFKHHREIGHGQIVG
jgi:hypothetical protein